MSNYGVIHQRSNNYLLKIQFHTSFYAMNTFEIYKRIVFNIKNIRIISGKSYFEPNCYTCYVDGLMLLLLIVHTHSLSVNAKQCLEHQIFVHIPSLLVKKKKVNNRI